LVLSSGEQLRLMIAFLQRLDRRDACVFLFTLSFVGLIYSKWFLSICLLSLIPLALLRITWSPKFRIGFRKNIGNYFQVYRSHPPYWALGLIVVTVLLSGLLFGGSEYWASRIRIKAPLLVAPLLIAFVPPLSKKQLHIWMIGIISIGIISLIGILGNYMLHYELIQEGLSKGQPIPTPISHIRYSLFIVLCLILSIWLSFEGKKSDKKTWIFAASGLFFTICLHILSVRSGLLATYAVLFFSLIYIVIKGKNPSLQAKISYMQYDLKQYISGEGNNYSDSDRLTSFAVGWSIFKENKWLGAGVSNFREVVKEKYIEQYPNQAQHKLPHSQYISLLASVGIFGFLLSMIGFLLPLFYRQQFYFFPLAAFYLAIATSMLTENTWESTVGLNLFLLPTLVLLNYLSGQKSFVQS